MRPAVLNHGYGLGPRLLLRLIRLMSGQPAPDVAKLTFYRSDFYGTHAKQFIQEAMRGRSAWSVDDRELMAAYVSKVNDSPFCIGAHTATATRAYQDPERVAAVLAAGVSGQQIEDALAVGFAFNTTDRLANAFGFDLLSQEGFEAGAKYLLKRGYA